MDEAAAWLQVKPRTIYQWFHWVQQGYIPVINLGALVRFDHAGIAAWLRERELPGRARQKVEFDVV